MAPHESFEYITCPICNGKNKEHDSHSGAKANDAMAKEASSNISNQTDELMKQIFDDLIELQKKRTKTVTGPEKEKAK